MVYDKEKSEEFAYHMRRDALDMSLAAGQHAVHFGAGMSIIDILAVLYGSVLRLDCDNPLWEDRDRFILSKGHGVIGYYAALAEVGYIDKAELQLFEKKNSFLLGHPIRTVEKGVEFTNGSLGMGLSLGIGTAIGAKKRGKAFKTYVLIGDGEMDEGAVWEALMAAPQFKLDNLFAIVDRNHMQLGGDTEQIIAHGNLKAKLEAFGWDVREIDGHDHDAIYGALTAEGQMDRPKAVIANTIKGKGFQFSENNNAWHHAVMTNQQYEAAIAELEESYHGSH
ncbi:MAG: transketolase [Lachnoclostridium sp.]|nr:transketolase [Lachnospira sp.]MCM1247302.1 transketolase [Lachnoclostridium sp.]MCM1534396.1 transketolase [Clostridium sp.]